MVKDYIPDKGDIVWLQFDPQKGKEQKGKRPALVISNKRYNKVVGRGIFCPVTSRKKGYPFEVNIPEDIKINGVILADQVKSLDWKERKAEYICSTDEKTVEKVVRLIGKLIN